MFGVSAPVADSSRRLDSVLKWRIRECFWARRKGCSPTMACTGSPMSAGRLGAFWADI